MFKVIFALLKSNPIVRYIFVFIIALLLGAAAHWYFADPITTIVREPGQKYVETVYVDKPVLVTQDVLKYVTDKKEVEKLLKELAFLENKVMNLTESIKTLESQGAGKIVYQDVPGPAGKTVREANFKDWRLTFTAKDDAANYTLSQKFEILATAGRDVNGRPTATTRLFEIGPNDERNIATAVSQVVVVGNATDGKQHWKFGLNLVAGVGYTRDTTLKTQSPAGLVGMRWMTRGATKAAEDGVWAAASPVVIIDQKGTTEFGILPVSYNAGQVMPFFKDMWVSPVIGFKTTPFGVSRFGLGISATF
jgi:hypothetical protein